MLLIDVVLPVPMQGKYSYAVSPDSESAVQIGKRVVIQFGKKKLYTGIIMGSLRVVTYPEGTKEIIAILDDLPIIPESQLKFWEWLAMYYMSSLGDVYRAAIPSALKLESETQVKLNPDFEATEPLNTNELAVYHCLSPDKPSDIAELQKLTGINNVIPAVKSLVDKGVAFISETVEADYSAKTIPAIRLSKAYSEEELNEVLDNLKRAKKQYDLLLAFLDLAESNEVILKKDLLDITNSTPTVLNELLKKGVLEQYDYGVNRLDYGNGNIEKMNRLNEYQSEAYQNILTSFETKDVTLLHGVTSSGKTEIYIQLIHEMILQGKQVLYLLPEIALTTQITERLKRIFGNQLGVYHSKFNENERAETWNKLLKRECNIILGARSSIFLPFTNLGLVIVDEEHESSYKQQDPSPRYHARNAAVVLASMHKAKTLLGTATPSIESYYNALNGRYGLVSLTKRHEDIALPHIEVVNVKELRRTKKMKSILSPPLAEQMKEVLDKGEQVILFQNRRGFSSMVECKICSWTLHCKHCDVSLTFHKGQSMMVCHYCGSTYRLPEMCEECKTPTLEVSGYGTERVQEEVSQAFPEANIARMDLDTTRGKKAYERMIGDFEANRTNILIGTQMVSKGLDFDNVSIVGILNADNMLNLPDFRAYERAFQLMMQVSGRAGRKNKQGKALLQTSHPANPIIRFVKDNDYESFYQLQIEERRLFRYPPFYRLINIVIRHRDERVVEQASRQFAEGLKQSFGSRILGPAKPPIARVQSLYIRKIMIKIENQASITKVRETIYMHQAQTFGNGDYKSILLHYDVDPV